MKYNVFVQSTIEYILLGIASLIVLLVVIIILTIFASRIRERLIAKRTVRQLTQNNTPKLNKEEQFKVLDDDNGYKRIYEIMNTTETPMFVENYFIDVDPDEYYEHLKKNTFPKTWLIGMFEWAEINRLGDKPEIIYYTKDIKTSTKTFDSYEKLLKFLVYQRLTDCGYKYRSKIKKSYYA